MILTALRRVISVTISLLMLVSANTFGHLKEQYDSIASVTKLEDGFYMMDYSYDYDIDKCLTVAFRPMSACCSRVWLMRFSVALKAPVAPPSIQ